MREPPAFKKPSALALIGAKVQERIKRLMRRPSVQTYVGMSLTFMAAAGLGSYTTGGKFCNEMPNLAKVFPVMYLGCWAGTPGGSLNWEAKFKKDTWMQACMEYRNYLVRDYDGGAALATADFG